MEEAVKLMQDHFTKRPPEQSPFFTENSKELKKTFDTFNPTLRIGKEPAGILPAGARVIEIDIPFFRLALTRSNGGSKIFRTMFYVH